MKVLLNKENVVFDFGEDIIFAKGGAEDGGLQPCGQAEATHIWNREKNTAVMNNDEFVLVEVDEIPEGVKEYEYKYIDGEFVINEDYKPYVSPEEMLSENTEVLDILLTGEEG